MTYRHIVTGKNQEFTIEEFKKLQPSIAAKYRQVKGQKLDKTIKKTTKTFIETKQD